MSPCDTKILLNGIRLYGHHGVGKDEQTVGSWYEIDIVITADISAAAYHDDDLGGTINYADVLTIIKHEFSTPAQLLEHLAYRISKAVLETFARALQIDIYIQKVAPPLRGNIYSAAVRFSLSRD